MLLTLDLEHQLFADLLGDRLHDPLPLDDVIVSDELLLVLLPHPHDTAEIVRERITEGLAEWWRELHLSVRVSARELVDH